MNPTSAVSVAFDPLLSWEILAGLGAIGVVLIVLSLRRPRPRHLLAAGHARRGAAGAGQPLADRGAAQADRRRGAGRDRRFRFHGDRRAPHPGAGRARGAEEEAHPAGRPRSPRSRAAALAHPARQRAAGRHAPDRDHALGPGRGAAGAAGRRGPPDRRPGARRACDRLQQEPAARARRRAGPCPDRRQEERARPADRHGAVAALRRGRPRGHRQVQDRGSRRRHRAGDPVGERRGRAPHRRAGRQVGRAADHRRQSRRQRRRARGGARPERAHARQQPRPVHHQRRARPAARAAGLGRALPGRAGVAEPA